MSPLQYIILTLLGSPDSNVCDFWRYNVLNDTDAEEPEMQESVCRSICLPSEIKG